MKFFPAFLAVALGVPAAVTLAPAAMAQVSDADRSLARDLFNEGTDDLDHQKFAAAADKFTRAEELFHAPTMLLGLARAYRGLGKFLEAKEVYNRLLNETLAPGANEAFQQSQKDAAVEVVGIGEKLGFATIRVTASVGTLPSDVAASLDGEDLKRAAWGMKRPMNPGQHQLSVEGSGFKKLVKKFEVSARKNELIDAKLLPLEAVPVVPVVPVDPIKTDPGPTSGALQSTVPQAGPSGADARAPSTQPTLGWVAVGLGGAGLILGGVTGGLALSLHSELQTLCPTGTCGPGEADKLSSYELMGNLSTVGFIAGGVLGAAGVVLLVTAPRTATAATAVGGSPVSLAVGPAGVRATFQF